MDIKWFTPNVTLPTVTLSRHGLTFNSSSIQFLEGVRCVQIGLDPKTKQVLIKRVDPKAEPGFSIPEMNGERRSYRINCRDFVQYLETKHGVDLETSKKYYLENDTGEDWMYFNIGQPIKENKRKRSAGK